jgi:glycosyltransferase involved in cell wall biosynthesis
LTETPAPRGSFVLVTPWNLGAPGGVNEVVVNLHRQIAQAGEFAPLVLVNRWSAHRPTETVVEGRRTIYFRLASPWTDRSWWGFAKWLLASPLFFADLWRMCRRHRIAVFNVHYPSGGAFALAIARALRLFRGDLVLSFHGSDLADAQRGDRVERWLWRFTFRRSTAVAACSRAFADDLQSFTSSDARVAVVHNGLDVDYFVGSVDRNGEWPAALGTRPFILGVATFERKKGLDVLLRAFAEVRRSRPGLALVLAGRRAEATGELRALASELDLDGDVFFFENVPHARVGAFFERAAVFCLPSRAEPFGIVLLEAGAFRLPVVASRVGGIPEIIDDGDTGLLTAPDDVAGLAAALRRALGDGDFARAAGTRLYNRVESDFSWTRAYEGYKSLLTGHDRNAKPTMAVRP